MAIRAAVVDDEPAARRELAYLLKKNGLAVVGEAGDGEGGLSLVETLKPDVLFLDIRMPPPGGIEVARKVLQKPEPPLLVFTTAYDQYAVEAFEVDALDYLVKPFSEERVRRTVDRLAQEMARGKRGFPPAKVPEEVATASGAGAVTARVPVKAEGRLRLLDPAEVLFAYLQGHDVIVKTAKGSHVTTLDFSEMPHRLGAEFFRVHKSFVVNLRHVREVIPWFKGTFELVMQDGTRIPVSRSRVAEVKERLGIN